jgi:hypothetical protein
MNASQNIVNSINKIVPPTTIIYLLEFHLSALADELFELRLCPLDPQFESTTIQIQNYLKAAAIVSKHISNPNPPSLQSIAQEILNSMGGENSLQLLTELRQL